MNFSSRLTLLLLGSGVFTFMFQLAHGQEYVQEAKPIGQDYASDEMIPASSAPGEATPSVSETLPGHAYWLYIANVTASRDAWNDYTSRAAEYAGLVPPESKFTAYIRSRTRAKCISDQDYVVFLRNLPDDSTSPFENYPAPFPDFDLVFFVNVVLWNRFVMSVFRSKVDVHDSWNMDHPAIHSHMYCTDYCGPIIKQHRFDNSPQTRMTVHFIPSDFGRVSRFGHRVHDQNFLENHPTSRHNRRMILTISVLHHPNGSLPIIGYRANGSAIYPPFSSNHSYDRYFVNKLLEWNQKVIQDLMLSKTFAPITAKELSEAKWMAQRLDFPDFDTYGHSFRNSKGRLITKPDEENVVVVFASDINRCLDDANFFQCAEIPPHRRYEIAPTIRIQSQPFEIGEKPATSKKHTCIGNGNPTTFREFIPVISRKYFPPQEEMVGIMNDGGYIGDDDYDNDRSDEELREEHLVNTYCPECTIITRNIAKQLTRAEKKEILRTILNRNDRCPPCPDFDDDDVIRSLNSQSWNSRHSESLNNRQRAKMSHKSTATTTMKKPIGPKPIEPTCRPTKDLDNFLRVTVCNMESINQPRALLEQSGGGNLARSLMLTWSQWNLLGRSVPSVSGDFASLTYPYRRF